MAKNADTAKDMAKDDLALIYHFNGDGQLMSVQYAGQLTPEIYQRIKDAALRAREIGKGRA